MIQARNLRGILGNVFDNPCASVLHSLKSVNNSCPLSFGRHSVCNLTAQCSQREVQGNLSQGVRNEEEALFSIFHSVRKETIKKSLVAALRRICESHLFLETAE